MIEGITVALDGSTYAGSVAVIRDGAVVAARELPPSDTPGRSGRDENFMPMVADALRDAGVSPRQVDRVVCGAGPGSFTSLRIAASIGKGLAVGAGCPLYAVSSLALMVAGLDPGRYLATLPAMRGEVFALPVERDAAGVVRSGDATIIADESADREAEKAGARRVSERPHARAVANVLAWVVSTGPCDIDSWEPQYGRLAEAQVKWEAAHGRPLTVSG